jgi:hypothetical protein
MEPEEKAVGRERLCKHYSTAKDKHATTEKLLEAVFSVGSALRLFNEDRRLYTELRLALRNATTAKILVISAPTANNPHDVCGAVVGTCIGNALRRQIQDLRRAAAIAPKYKERNLIQRYTEAAVMRKEKGTTSSQRDPLGGSSSLSLPHQSSPTQLYCVKTSDISNYTYRRHVRKACGTPWSSICHNRTVSRGSRFD